MYQRTSKQQAITCLAMHPDRDHVATGQGGSSPFVLVWSTVCKSMSTRARLQLGTDKIGVSQVRVGRATITGAGARNQGMLGTPGTGKNVNICSCPSLH